MSDYTLRVITEDGKLVSTERFEDEIDAFDAIEDLEKTPGTIAQVILDDIVIGEEIFS